MIVGGAQFDTTPSSDSRWWGTDEVSSSWHRSAVEYGIDPDSRAAPHVVTDGELQSARAPLTALLGYAYEEIERLYAIVRQAGYTVLVSNPLGLVIDHRPSDSMASRWKYWGAWSGAVWSEELEGTNVIGTCVAEQRPVSIHREQHFRTRYAELSCAAAPIFDATARLAAVVDSTSLTPAVADRSHVLALAATTTAAHAITERLFREHFRDRWIIAAARSKESGPRIQLAIDAGLSAFATPLGMLEAGADTYAGAIPTILKLNSSNSHATSKDQAVYGSVHDALRLGCSAIGFTIYPGSDHAFDMMEEIRELAEEAKSVGLAVVIWSYPRGDALSKDGETAIDICAYAAHMAALLGAHIIKVKPPTSFLEQAEAKKVYEKQEIDISTAVERIRHVVQARFNGKRIVVFSGGAAKGEEGIFEEARAIRDGGGNGSIIGRNTFQRPRAEALKLLDGLIKIYQSKE